MGCGCGEVDVVISGSGTNNYLQLLGGVEHFGIYLVGTDDECVGILHCVEKLLLLCIFLKQGEGVACSLDLCLYALDSCCCEWLLCCY